MSNYSLQGEFTMYVGLLTAPFIDQSLDVIAKWAAGAGFKALEVYVDQIDLGAVLADNGTAVKRVLAETGISISSFAYYVGFDEGYSARMREIIAAADVLGVDTVCTFAGFPEAGKSKVDTIMQVVPKVINPLAEEAARSGVRLAFENWFETNLQNLECFAALCEALPQENVGFNFDPSHLHWQGIDVVGAVQEFGARIFHTHAKDVTIYPTKLARLGVKAYGWWEYSIPGYGAVPWGPYLRALRQAGYNGVLSIEHEDPTYNAEEGFVKGLKFLSGLM